MFKKEIDMVPQMRLWPEQVSTLFLGKERSRKIFKRARDGCGFQEVK